jgi:hypothetical protein
LKRVVLSSGVGDKSIGSFRQLLAPIQDAPDGYVLAHRIRQHLLAIHSLTPHAENDDASLSASERQ